MRWRRTACFALGFLLAVGTTAHAQRKPSLKPKRVFGDLRFRHGADVTSLTFVNKGKWIAASGGRAVSVWDSSGKRKRIFRSRRGTIAGIVEISDSVLAVAGELASDSKKNFVTIWDLDADTKKRRSVDGNAVALDGNRDGTLAVAVEGGDVVFLKKDGTRLRWHVGSEFRPIRSLSIGPRSLRAACAHHSQVKIVDVESGRTEIRWELVDVVRTVTFDPNGKRVAATTQDGVLHVLDAETGNPIWEHTLPDCADGLAWFPDGTSIVATDYDGTVTILGAKDGKVTATHRTRRESLFSACVSPDGKKIAVGAQDIRVIDPTNPTSRETNGHRSVVTAVTFSADGRWIASGARDGRIRIWDPEAGKQIRALNHPMHVVRAVAFDPKRRYVAGTGAQGTLVVWEAKTGKRILRRHIKSHSVEGGACFSPDGLSIAWAVGKRWQRLRVPDGKRLDDGKCTELILQVGMPRNDVARAVTRWRLCSLLPAKDRGEGDRLRRLWMSRSGRFLAAQRRGRLEVVDLLSHEICWRPDGTLGGDNLAVAPSGKLVAYNDYKNNARVIDATTASECAVVGGHAEQVASAAFSDCGRYMLTGSYDSTVALWDLLESKDPLEETRVRNAPEAVAALTEGGYPLITGIRWAVRNPGPAVAALRTALGRKATEAYAHQRYLLALEFIRNDAALRVVRRTAKEHADPAVRADAERTLERMRPAGRVPEDR